MKAYQHGEVLRAGGESGRFWQSCAGGKAPGLASQASPVPEGTTAVAEQLSLAALEAVSAVEGRQGAWQVSARVRQGCVQPCQRSSSCSRLPWCPVCAQRLCWALAAPSLARPRGSCCRRAFPSAQRLMTQPDTGWQELWWVYRGTVSPDMGTVHLLWSGAALVACTEEAWLLSQTHFLITASFSSFLLSLPLVTWVHSLTVPEPVGMSFGFSYSI